MNSQVDIRYEENEPTSETNVQSYKIIFQSPVNENGKYPGILDLFDMNLPSDDLLLPSNRWKAFIEILKIFLQVTIDLKANQENEQVICINIQENQDAMELMASLKDSLTVLLPQPIFLEHDMRTNQIIISPH